MGMQRSPMRRDGAQGGAMGPNEGTQLGPSGRDMGNHYDIYRTSTYSQSIGSQASVLIGKLQILHLKQEELKKGLSK